MDRRNLPMIPRMLSLLVAPLLPVLLAGAPPAGSNWLFPMASCQRLGDPWLASRNDQPLFTGPFQARKAAEFKAIQLGPWDPAFVTGHRTSQVANLEALVLANLRKDIAVGLGFGPNTRPYDAGWLERIQRQLPTAAGPFRFRPGNRAMILDNALVRLLPTADLYMQHPDLPGQGYAFDNLQNSALWAGTPAYLLDRTRNQAWCKVLAADCAGWVPTQSLALAGAAFVRQWRRTVARNGLVAVTGSETPVVDSRGRFRFLAYVGSVFPRRPAPGARPGILIPARNAVTRKAECQPGFLPAGGGVPQPWPYTPRHAALLWHTLLGRPYGWGNTGFRNDCSAELKHFFAPFGLWLPRHSSDQKDVGRSQDLSGLPLQERLQALDRIGHPYRSLIWIDGHVMLYLGPLQDPSPGPGQGAGFMSYQNLWALRPRDRPQDRAVIGASVLFPVRDRYPEAPDLRSLADRSRFVVTQLDAEPQAR